MKPIIPIVITSVAMFGSGGPVLHAQEPSEPPVTVAPVAVAETAPGEEQAHAHEEVNRQIEQANEAALAAQTEAEAQVKAATALADKQLAQARAAIALAQASAPGKPELAVRLQKIVNHGPAGASGSLVVRSSNTDAKAQGNLEEDLAVMSHIFDKALDANLGGNERARTAMGINVLFAPGASPIRSLFLEGYGAVFMLHVRFPLLPPPAQAEEKKEKPREDTEWQQAKRELYGQPDGLGEFGKAMRVYTKGFLKPGPVEEYDAEKVNRLKEALLEALKNATNVRGVKSDETITVCVLGTSAANAGGPPKPGRDGDAADSEDDDANRARVVLEDSERDASAFSRGTIMTIRVKKADVDAFAKGEMNLDDFRKKVGITIYSGGTAGWDGGNPFGWGGVRFGDAR